MMKCKYLLLFFSIVFIYSCKSIPNDIVFFDDLQVGKALPEIPISTLNEEPKILPDNSLSIIVSSSNLLDTKLLEQFNLLPLTSIDPQISRVNTNANFQSYIVDKNGEIVYPILGKIKVEGLTVPELRILMASKLAKYISEPIININLINNRIKIYGEVRSPGVYQLGNIERYSVLDAIAYAGDITLYGNKKSVKLLREDHGKMESVLLDLTSTEIFSSPYFYLKQNDIIVVDPNKTKKKDSTYGNADNYRLSIISTVIGCLSLVASTIVTIVSLNR